MLGLSHSISLGSQRVVAPSTLGIAPFTSQTELVGFVESEFSNNRYFGPTSETGFTKVTVTDADDIETEYATWKATADWASDKLIIELDFDGRSGTNIQVLNGPAASEIGSGSEMGGFETLGAEVWIKPASGRTPILDYSIYARGIPKFCLEGVGIAAGTGTTTRMFRFDRNATNYPYYSQIAIKDCTLGQGLIGAIDFDGLAFCMTGEALSLWVEGCTFNGFSGGVSGTVRYLYTGNNTFRNFAGGDVINSYGSSTNSDWSGVMCYILVEDNIAFQYDKNSSSAIHPDFFQLQTNDEYRAGVYMVAQRNVFHGDGLGTSKTQFIFTKNNARATGAGNFRLDLAVRDNVAAPSAYFTVHYAESSGLGSLFVKNNLFSRSANFPTDSDGDQRRPYVTFGSDESGNNSFPDLEYGSQGGVFEIEDNYLSEISGTSLVDAGQLTTSNNIFIDPQNGVATGSGTEASPYRPEQILELPTAARDGSDQFTYETGESFFTSVAEGVWEVLDQLEPQAGWGNGVGPSDPSTWPHMPARPTPFVANGALFADPNNTPSSVEVIRAEFVVTFNADTAAYDPLLFQGQNGLKLEARTGIDVRVRARDTTNSDVLALTQATNVSVPVAVGSLEVAVEFDYGAEEARVYQNKVLVDTIAFTASPSTAFVRDDNRLAFLSSAVGSTVDPHPTDLEITRMRVFTKAAGAIRFNLYKEISLADQGDIAGINADAWLASGAVVAA